MKHDELARRVAALFLITDKKNEVEQVEKKLQAILGGQHFEEVSARIKHYLKNPPENLVKLGYDPQAPAWLNSEAQKALSDAGITSFDYLSTLMESDVSVQLLNKIDTPTAEAVELDWLAFKESKDPEALERILQFYSKHGLDFVPPSPTTAQTVKEIRQKAQLDTTPVIPESEITSEEDLALLAQNAARDSTLSPFEPPTSQIEHPNLMEPHPLLDPKHVEEFPPDETCPFHNRVIVYNHRSVFHNYAKLDDGETPEIVESVDEFAKALPVPKAFYENLHQSILIRRGVVQQTGKGKIRRVAYMVLLGNADGLVGLGEGKHANSMVALKSARIDAVRKMDWVERFEKRTVWTEMRTKLGSTELILRPRPVGFGLRCNPYLHQILRAAGFKDISAKVWGSRNRLNVIKAAFRLLQAGHAPTGMGDGLGGPGKKMSKGSGLIGMKELERARGRKLVPLRK
ncbi:37S ribosomal protein S5 [Coprinopsis cinerea okayama7|uniref:37S ribosomal protein S5 n=1 Tax=Coprinopsis cinerea (strain Okayama-7 / 130 / ATCC MYA-4618 / FGSC 9003) TaxID=240176 RepID=A8NCQ2_COPC7|nr:37S ribosomal protein S5 [Coprinopsis cinerea okayama7\|eukprot:XP_001832596.2 37S ribosomal protein S5 [Coprinopsis cinerea okayama7\